MLGWIEAAMQQNTIVMPSLKIIDINGLSENSKAYYGVLNSSQQRGKILST